MVNLAILAYILLILLYWDPFFGIFIKSVALLKQTMSHRSKQVVIRTRNT